MGIVVMEFSPTGGTRSVLDVFRETFVPDVNIDLCTENIDYSFKKEDLCLVGVPSFGGRVPTAAADRIRTIRGNGAKAVLVVVYGNRAYEDTLLELKEVMEASGFETAAAVTAIAEHSIMRQFAEGRPDHEDKKELQQYAGAIKSWLNAHSSTESLNIPGTVPYKTYSGVPFKPKADKSCTQCRLCADNCPVHAIPQAEPASVNEKVCISCMRCVSICPNHARKLNKVVLSVAAQKMKKVCETRKKNELFLPS